MSDLEMTCADEPVGLGQAGDLRLADTLDLNAAATLTTQLLAARGQDVTLDGSAVRRIGGQCLQVLLSARTTWEADGYAFRIAAPSADLSYGLALMGCPDLADATPAQD